MPPHPSTSEGSALRKPRAKQGNRFLAHRLPSTARRRTPARCCARCLAYAPAIKSPARYRAGRSKQHNPARNVKPFPPRGSPRGTPRGQEGVKGDTCLSPSPFSLPFGKKRKDLRSSMHCRLNQCRTPPLLLPYPSFFLPLFSVKQKKSPQALFRCSYGQPPYPRPILAATSPSISSAAH